MMRYWTAHGKPVAVDVLRAKAGAEAVRIEPRGPDAITVDGRKIELQRYTVANLMFGREVLWMDPQGNLAAAMTFAGGLPLEAVRAEFEPALSDLYRAGLAQEMADLDAIARSTAPERSGAFAVLGATLVDATGAPPVNDAVVVVRDGRIAAAGPRARTPIPAVCRWSTPKVSHSSPASGKCIRTSPAWNSGRRCWRRASPRRAIAGASSIIWWRSATPSPNAMRRARGCCSPVWWTPAAIRLSGRLSPRRPKRVGLWSTATTPPDSSR